MRAHARATLMLVREAASACHAHAAIMRPLYAKRLAASAPAAGRPPAEAAKQAVALQRSSLNMLRSHDTAQVRGELKDPHDTIQRRTALPVFELLDQSKGKRYRSAGMAYT